MKRYFKVKYGFNVADMVSIDEKNLPRAILAQIEGIPVQLGNAYINGRNIISITPHWHKHTGWHEWYEPKNGDDWEQIERDCPSYEGLIENYKESVATLIRNNQTQLIAEIPLLSENMKTLKRGKGEVKQIGEIINEDSSNNKQN